MTTISLFHHSSDARDVAAGETIFAEGDKAEFMFYVLEGEVEIVHNNRTIDTINPGEIFGEMALLDSAPRSATATARVKCRVVPISEKRFLFLVQQTPFFALQVMRIMSDRLRRKMDCPT